MRIELPQVGESVTEGVIGKWLRQVGDSVEKYDPLVEVTTDKQGQVRADHFAA